MIKCSLIWRIWHPGALGNSVQAVVLGGEGGFRRLTRGRAVIRGEIICGLGMHFGLLRGGWRQFMLTFIIDLYLKLLGFVGIVAFTPKVHAPTKKSAILFRAALVADCKRPLANRLFTPTRWSTRFSPVM